MRPQLFKARIPMGLSDPICQIILHEAPGANHLSADERFGLVSALLARGLPVSRVVDEPVRSPEDKSRTVVLSNCNQSATANDADWSWHLLNAAPIQATVQKVESIQTNGGAAPPNAWKPWFPVIDYDRCTNCMQCLSFCLFGVYGVDEQKRIQVQHQDNCKTNCPACSRVCPEAAIMFPKYKAGPINGDVVSDSDLNREKMKIDISALLGGDVYAMLRTRSERAQSRFSKERDSDKALAERQKCLVKLGSVVSDIPPEVLMSLPSPEEIARKAEEAAAKAKAALQSLPAT